MYKAIKLRSKAEYLVIAEQIARGSTTSRYHHNNLIPYLDSLPFVPTAMVTCGMRADFKDSNLAEAMQWLQENATAPYELEGKWASIGFLAIFADEGDAIRFAWSREKESK